MMQTLLTEMNLVLEPISNLVQVALMAVVLKHEMRIQRVETVQKMRKSER